MIGVFAPKRSEVETVTHSTPVVVEVETPEPTPTVVTLPSGEVVTASQFTLACRELIREALTLPHTVNFLGVFGSDFAQTRPEMANQNIFTQRFETDSQNLFGATIRIQWRCMLDGYDGSYTLSHNQ